MGGVNRVLLVGTISKYGIDMALQPQSASCHAGHDSVCGWRADREIHPPHRRYIVSNRAKGSFTLVRN